MFPRKYIIIILILCCLMYALTFIKSFDIKKINIKLKQSKTLPPLFIITPTYRRPEQLAELTRLGNTLKHVKNLLWLVIDDAREPSILVKKILNRIQVPYIYLIAPMPGVYQKKKGAKPRGVSNRNRALKWLRDNVQYNQNDPSLMGVFYFADDDNSYDVSLFDEIRYTRKISFFPVGLVTKLGVSSPILKNGTFIGWYDGWIGKRKYAVDMAGFAVSVHLLFERPNAKMPFVPGYEEDGFLKSLGPINSNDIQYLANNGKEILCWHTQSKKNNNPEKLDLKKYDGTNLVQLNEMLVSKIAN